MTSHRPSPPIILQLSPLQVIASKVLLRACSDCGRDHTLHLRPVLLDLDLHHTRVDHVDPIPVSRRSVFEPTAERADSPHGLCSRGAARSARIAVGVAVERIGGGGHSKHVHDLVDRK